MRTCLRKSRRCAHAIQLVCFWLLAVEGAVLSLLFLIPPGQGLLTHLALVRHEPISTKVAVILFCLLAMSSIWATSVQVRKKQWTTVPTTLLLWLAVGGSFLLFLIFNQAVAPGWDFVDAVFLSSIGLTSLLFSLSTVTETLLTYWLERGITLTGDEKAPGNRDGMP